MPKHLLIRIKDRKPLFIKFQVMRIVLAIDGSDFSKTAIDELAALPLPSDTEVRIISVLRALFWPLRE